MGFDNAVCYYDSGSCYSGSGIVTKDFSLVMKACRELKGGTTKADGVAGSFLTRTHPGGLRDSKLGEEERIDALKFFNREKNRSLPW